MIPIKDPRISFKHTFAVLLFCCVFLLLIPGCAQAEEDGISSRIKQNWKEYLERARNGTGLISHTKGLHSKSTLNGLLKYLTQNKERIYKGDEGQWLYDRAMIKLMASEFIESFKLFKDYIELTGDDIRPWLHVGLRIGMNNLLLKRYFTDVAIDNAAANPDHRFTKDEVLYLLDYIATSHFFAVMPKEKIDAEAKRTEEYLKELSSYRPFEEDVNQYSPDELIDKLYYLDFPEWYIEDLVNNDPNDKEIDLIYKYYWKKKLYHKAYTFAKKYGFGKTIKIGAYEPQPFLRSILEVLYSLGKYDELIKVFEEYSDNRYTISLERTYSSGYFWVASVYAQKGEYDKAHMLLRKAFDNTSLISKLKRVDGIEMNTFSLIWHILLSDAFDKFKEAGRYDEIDQIMEQGLAKYKHLDWFKDY